MQIKAITADEHETISLELSDKTESRLPDLWMISGRHEDLGRTVLRLQDGVYMVEAEDVSYLTEHGKA